MFKDYEIKKYLGYNSKNDTFEYEIKIIDDDFEENVFVAVRDTPTILVLARVATSAIIEIYYKKQLCIVENLILFILYLNQKYRWRINEIIEYLNKHVIEFNKYKEKIEKLLLFN